MAVWQGTSLGYPSGCLALGGWWWLSTLVAWQSLSCVPSARTPNARNTIRNTLWILLHYTPLKKKINILINQRAIGSTSSAGGVFVERLDRPPKRPSRSLVLTGATIYRR